MTNGGKLRPFPRPGIGPVAISPPPLQLPSLQLLQSYSDWRQDWTHIVAGKFTASPYSGLLFYEQSSGTAEFYETDGNGGISLLRQYNDWRRSWTHIVPGIFGNSGYTGLLLYDQAAGFGAFYDTDGHGNIVLLREHDDWRTSWTQILSGRFTFTPFFSVLFYEQADGYAEIYETDGHGGIAIISSYSDWRQDWTHIVAGEFIDNAPWDDPPIDDLFFYEGSTGYGETYESDGQGGISLRASEDGLPTVTHIVPGSFGGGGNTNLLFLDGATGSATFRNFDGNKWVSLEDFSWQRSWDLLIPGNFWMADPAEDQPFPDGGFTDFVLYDRTSGYGEIYAHEPPDPTPIEPFAGYVSSGSILPGDTIDFHVSSQVGSYTITLYRQAANEVPVGYVEGLPSAPAPFPIEATAYKTGAGWPAAGSFTAPANWPSGLYLARIEIPRIVPTGEPPAIARQRPKGAPLGRYWPPPPVPPLDIPFVVRAPAGSRARILLAICDNTYSAYNFWGGRSVYGYGHNGQHTWVYPSSSPFRAPYGFHLSFLRGHSPAASDYVRKWQTWEVPFLRWVHRQGIQLDVCTESDLHKELGLLNGYRLLVIVGHSEYWSGGMRDQVEGFVRNGGNVAFFAGNVCWWQVRFEDDGDTMVCYKQKDFDPASKSASTLHSTTVNWHEHFLQRPETQLTGVRYCGVLTSPWVQRQFVVENADHWVFANTGLGNGDTFGLYGDLTVSVVGWETDCQQPDSPGNFCRLACVKDDGGNEIATMGLFSPIHREAEYSGIVFTAATINWTLGLSQDGGWNPMDLITRNILIRLG
jgi:hypothetical protein